LGLQPDRVVDPLQWVDTQRDKAVVNYGSHLRGQVRGLCQLFPLSADCPKLDFVEHAHAELNSALQPCAGSDLD
jgi:hypothetical protein